MVRRAVSQDARVSGAIRRRSSPFHERKANRYAFSHDCVFFATVENTPSAGARAVINNAKKAYFLYDSRTSYRSPIIFF
jgi:hypothetical protein